MLAAIKPQALIWIHSIMADPLPATPESSKLNPLILPSIYSRRAACTHLFMERLYGLDDCSVCQKPSPLGWVYTCIQNEESHSFSKKIPNVINEFGATSLVAGQQHNVGFGSSNSEDSREEAPTRPRSPNRLSPWIERAIEQGNYTPAQILKLRAQRQRVVEAIATAEEHIEKYPEQSANPPPASTNIVSHSIDANSYLPFPIINEVHENLKESDLDVTPSPKLRMFPQCTFRACHTCRPTFRDRAWLRLDDIFAMKAPLNSIDFDTDNRPVSSALVVRGLPVPKKNMLRPLLRSFGKFGLFDRSSALDSASTSPPRRLPIDFLGSNDLGDQKLEVESKGFREGMKRAFRGMLNRQYTSPSTRHHRRRVLREIESIEFDMGLWRVLNDDLLQEASNVPLPGHDGMDSLGHEEGEVEVADGVAVTEEGIDLGTADIIMSI